MFLSPVNSKDSADQPSIYNIGHFPGHCPLFRNSALPIRKAVVTRIVDGISYSTGYGYDPAGLISAMTYPDGRQVTYEWDAAGRVVRVLTEKDGRIRTVAENIACLPFGPVKGWAFGNGIDVTRTMDESYRPVRFTAGAAIDYAYSSDATPLRPHWGPGFRLRRS